MSNRIEHMMRQLIEGAECTLQADALAEMHAAKARIVRFAASANARANAGDTHRAPRVPTAQSA